MTPEETQKLMDFIITQNANTSANLAILTEKVTELTNSMETFKQVLDFVSKVTLENKEKIASMEEKLDKAG